MKNVDFSGAEIELFERDLILEIRGSKMTRRRAKKYCKGVMDQRTGPVSVTQDRVGGCFGRFVCDTLVTGRVCFHKFFDLD